MAGKNEVSIWIRAKDLASGKFRKFQRTMAATWRSAKKLAVGLAKVTAAAGALVYGLGRLAEQGGKVITVSAAFEKATNGQADAIDRLKRASEGLISEMDLMKGFNQAIALGSARNVDEFGQMIEVSQRLARALGIDVSYALQSMNTGIARQSRLWLDNLGIIVSIDEANKSYAAAIGKQVSQLTDAEKKEAFRKAALEEGIRIAERLGESTGKAGDSWVRFTTTVKDARDEMALFVAESPDMAEFFDALSRGVEAVAGKLPGVIRDLKEMAFWATDALGITDPIVRGGMARYHASDNKGQFAAGATTMLGGAQERVGDRQRAHGEAKSDWLRAYQAVQANNGLVSPIEERRLRIAMSEAEATMSTRREELEAARATLASMQELSTWIREMEGARIRAGAGGSSGGGGGGNGAPGLPGFPAPVLGAQDTGSSAIAQWSRRERAWFDATGGADATEIAALRGFEPEVEKVNAALLASVGAFQAVGMAAFDASASLEDVLLPSLTNIVAAAAGEAGGPVWGAAIGAIGGILGAAFNSNDRPRVVVDEYSSRARNQMREVNTERAVQLYIDGRRATGDEEQRVLGYRLKRVGRLQGESTTGV